jgi:hypothetical protein
VLRDPLAKQATDSPHLSSLDSANRNDLPKKGWRHEMPHIAKSKASLFTVPVGCAENRSSIDLSLLDRNEKACVGSNWLANTLDPCIVMQRLFVEMLHIFRRCCSRGGIQNELDVADFRTRRGQEYDEPANPIKMFQSQSGE